MLFLAVYIKHVEIWMNIYTAAKVVKHATDTSLDSLSS